MTLFDIAPTVRSVCMLSLICGVCAPPFAVANSAPIAVVDAAVTDHTAKAALLALIQDSQCLAANFTQQTTDQTGALVQESTGLAYAAKPQRMHWAINTPDSQSIISDGVTLWRYEQDLEQVIISAIADSQTDLPIALLSGDAERLDAYVIRQRDNVFLLQPKQDDAYFSELALGFSEGKLAQLVMKDSFNQTTDIQFKAIDEDCNQEDLYGFMPPPGIDIIYE